MCKINGVIKRKWCKQVGYNTRRGKESDKDNEQMEAMLKEDRYKYLGVIQV